MKTAAKTLAIVLIICIGIPLIANAVTWSPLLEEHEEKASAGIMTKGTIVCLFQSGTADVKKEIQINDMLPVYREDQKHHVTKVGIVKILSYVGEDYLKGEVIEGELKAGDVAKKGDVASLIISSDKQCK